MVKVNQKDTCCGTGGLAASCCRVESLLSVDERGQMVIPKEVRERANIKAGDKLALVSWEINGEVCCLSLIKSESLTTQIKQFLGPVMGNIMSNK